MTALFGEQSVIRPCLMETPTDQRLSVAVSGRDHVRRRRLHVDVARRVPIAREQQRTRLPRERDSKLQVVQKIARANATITAIATHTKNTCITKRNMSRSERSGFHTGLQDVERREHDDP